MPSDKPHEKTNEKRLPDLGGGVVERPHAGDVFRVTTVERSFVDVLDAPERRGGWEGL
jgi:hypothetical protein